MSFEVKEIVIIEKENVIEDETDHFLWHEIFLCGLLNDHFDKIKKSFNINTKPFFFFCSAPFLPKYSVMALKKRRNRVDTETNVSHSRSPHPDPLPPQRAMTTYTV